jgi:AraC-like DNA-binding protein
MQVLINLSRDYLTDCREDGSAIQQQPGSIVMGARARFEVIDTADLCELAGVVIEPGGFGGLFRERADLLFEQSVALDSLWRDERLAEGLHCAGTPAGKLDQLEEALGRLVRHTSRRCEAADHALSLFRGRRLSVAQCARTVGLSERRLSQVFREEVGVSPKTWCRIQRFQAAIKALHDGVDMPWAELALSCGYYDQAHFANDFKAFSSIDPTTYSAQKLRWRNHVPMV